MRIEVGVQDNNRVSCCQVDTYPTSTSREQESKQRRALCIEFIDTPLLFQGANMTIKALIAHLKTVKEILNDILTLSASIIGSHLILETYQHVQKLTENENSMAALTQFRKHYF